MAQATIGSLRVTLGMDSAAFEKGLGQAQKGLVSFSASMSRVGKALGAATAGIAAALGAVAIKTAGVADEMYKAGQSLGVPIDELSRMRHAAEMSGASFDSLQTSLRRLSQNMFDASQGIGEGKAAFDQLGLSVVNSDGTLKSATAIMGEIADKFAAMKDGAEKTALATEIGGRSFAALIPMLNAGAAGLRSMYAESDRLGITFDAQTGKASERLNDNMARLQKTAQGLAQQISAQLIPYMADVSDTMVTAAGKVNVLMGAVSPLISLLKHLTAAAIRIGAAFKGVGMDISAAASAMKSFFSGDFSGGIANFKTGISETQKYLKDTEELIGSILAIGTGAGEKQALPNYVTATFASVGKAAADGIAAGYKGGIETFYGGLLSGLESTAKTVSSAAASAGAGAANAFKGGLASIGDPWEGMRESMASAFDKMKDLGSQLGSTIKGLIDGTKSWKDVLLDVVAAFAKFAFSKINFGGMGGFGGLLSGLLGSLFGFAQGGMFKVGGVGGIDSQLVAFKASPNETVSVTKPGQAGVGGMHITFGLASDGDLNIRPVVQSIARGEASVAAGHLARAVPSIVDARNMDRQLRGTRP